MRRKKPASLLAVYLVFKGYLYIYVADRAESQVASLVAVAQYDKRFAKRT